MSPERVEKVVPPVIAKVLSEGHILPPKPAQPIQPPPIPPALLRQDDTLTGLDARISEDDDEMTKCQSICMSLYRSCCCLTLLVSCY